MKPSTENTESNKVQNTPVNEILSLLEKKMGAKTSIYSASSPTTKSLCQEEPVEDSELWTAPFLSKVTMDPAGPPGSINYPTIWKQEKYYGGYLNIKLLLWMTALEWHCRKWSTGTKQKDLLHPLCPIPQGMAAVLETREQSSAITFMELLQNSLSETLGLIPPLIPMAQVILLPCFAFFPMITMSLITLHFNIFMY